MRNALMLMVAVVGAGMFGTTAVRAENRAIEELPGDLFRWSTMWVRIPQEMVEEGREHGPLAALTMGPANGTAAMVEETGADLWKAAKPEKRPGHRRPQGDNTKSVIFRYEF